MTKINAKIIKHSVDHRGNELITYELVFARYLLSELNTHRMFSKNSASSRAIPFKKMVEMVKTDAFVPSAWQKEHKGMQGSEYLTGLDSIKNNAAWLRARDLAVERAEELSELGVTKQLCNRLLEPFMWHKVLLTTGKEGLQNFFELRCPEYMIGLTPYKSKKECVNSQRTLQEPSPECIGFTELDWLSINKGQAEIHMMELSESMYDTYNESVPQKLKVGEWHIPYDDIIDAQLKEAGHGVYFGNHYTTLIKASTGLCARTSYLTVGDDKSPSIETLIGIHDKMLTAVPFHASPFEHCCQVATDEEYRLAIRGSMEPQGCETERYEDGSYSEDLLIPENSQGWFYNFRGFKSYRYILEQKK